MERGHKDAVEVVFSWGGTPTATEIVRGEAPLTIGAGTGVSFVLPPEVAGESFVLLAREPGGFVLSLPPGALVEGERREPDGTIAPVEMDALPIHGDGIRQMRLSPGTEVTVALGELAFFFRHLDEVETVDAPIAIDWSPWRFVGASLAVHAAILLMLLLQPPSAGAMSLALDHTTARELLYRIDAFEEPEPEPEPETIGGTEGQRAEGDEGATGAIDEERNTGGGVSVQGDDSEPRVPMTRETAAHAGILGVLESGLASLHVSSLFGDPVARGWSTEDAYGPPMAASLGFGPGNGGLGMIGTGRGGGCPPGADCSRGTVGVGEFGTIGTGHCDREEFARIEAAQGRAAAVARCTGVGGTGTLPRTREHRERVPTVRHTQADVVGGLSREQIRRVVHRNLPQVRHCYEQELVQRPDLAGRVAVSFVIAPTGAIQSAEVLTNDTSSDRLGGCISQAVRRWAFPAAPGVTVVTYPFRLEQQ